MVTTQNQDCLIPNESMFGGGGWLIVFGFFFSNFWSDNCFQATVLINASSVTTTSRSWEEELQACSCLVYSILLFKFVQLANSFSNFLVSRVLGLRGVEERVSERLLVKAFVQSVSSFCAWIYQYLNFQLTNKYWLILFTSVNIFIQAWSRLKSGFVITIHYCVSSC